MSDAEKVAAFDALTAALTNRWRDGTWTWFCPCPCGGDHPRWRREDAIRDLVDWAVTVAARNRKKLGVSK